MNDYKEQTENQDDSTEQEKYVLTLYIAGQTPRSVNAIINIKRICERELKGRYSLEIVDIFQESAQARNEQLVALPTLIKRLPAPLSRIIGDLADTEKVLIGLNIRKTDH
jgi:circadian clock protein KaiB